MASQRHIISRLALWRLAVAVLIGILSFAPGLAFARSIPRAYAGIVVDAKTGEPLYQSHADSLRYPASITKVMTLYVLFQEIEAGRIKLTDMMPVSRHAAAASPTKLGAPAGSSVSVRDAVKSLVTISANDMARVIAEYVSGSEEKFAKRMTATAKALGMKHTFYANASGLPDSRQVTTVRDQSILGVAIYQHFPQFISLMTTRSFQYGRRTYHSHVPLFGVDGVEGLKTGWIRASGYNVMTVAREHGRHLVVVGFGFKSIGDRNSKVRRLLAEYLPKARSGDTLRTALIPEPGHKGSPLPDDGIRVASASPPVPMPVPAFRAVTLAPVLPAEPPDLPSGGSDGIAVASIAPRPIERPIELPMPPAIQAANMLAGVPAHRTTLDEVVGAFTDSYRLGAPPAPLGQTRPSAPLIPPVGVGEDGQPVDLMTSGSISTEASRGGASNAPAQDLGVEAVAEATDDQPMPAALPSGWVVQVGAAPTATGANSLLDDAGRKVRSLAAFQSFVQRYQKGGQTYFRARFGGFTGQDAATDMCKRLKQANMSCLAMQS